CPCSALDRSAAGPAVLGRPRGRPLPAVLGHGRVRGVVHRGPAHVRAGGGHRHRPRGHPSSVRRGHGCTRGGTDRGVRGHRPSHECGDRAHRTGLERGRVHHSRGHVDLGVAVGHLHGSGGTYPYPSGCSAFHGPGPGPVHHGPAAPSGRGGPRPVVVGRAHHGRCRADQPWGDRSGGNTRRPGWVGGVVVRRGVCSDGLLVVDPARRGPDRGGVGFSCVDTIRCGGRFRHGAGRRTTVRSLPGPFHCRAHRGGPSRPGVGPVRTHHRAA